MATDSASQEFQWQDKQGLTWHGYMEETPIELVWRIRPGNIGGRYQASVLTHSPRTHQHLPMAYLTDVRIDKRLENRGVGSMLVQRAIEECKRRGHKDMEGDLSDVDRGHFDKLKHFYEKLGFSVVFHELNNPDYRPWQAGKIEMIFGETNTT